MIDNMVYVHGMKMTQENAQATDLFCFVRREVPPEAFGVEMNVLCCCGIVNLC